MSALKLHDVPVELEAASQVIITGDLSKLTDVQKAIYLKTICTQHGLNPLTQPFAIMTFQGKQVLYAKKECAVQLASLRNISVEIRSTSIDDHGIMTVESRAIEDNRRFTDEIACLSVKGLSGEAFANARMKCVTKAKRRATLSHCGLGMPDESEIEPTFQQSQPTQIKTSKPEPTAIPQAALAAGLTLEASALQPTELEYTNLETGEVTNAPTVHTPAFDPTNTDHCALFGRAMHELKINSTWCALHSGKLKGWLFEQKVPAIYSHVYDALISHPKVDEEMRKSAAPVSEAFDANTAAHSLMLDEVFTNLKAPKAFVESNRAKIEKALEDTQTPATFSTIKEVVLQFKAESKK